jgi:hypothetical protein
MREKLITPFIVLFALLTTSIFNIVYKVEIFHSMIRLLIVFVVFYMIGKISEKVIIKAIKKDVLTNNKSENDEVVDVMVDMTDMTDMTDMSKEE